MSILKKTLFAEDLEKYKVLIEDTNPDSRYFRISELSDTFTGGKNAFLIQGSPELVQDTIVKIEIKDSLGNVIYHEPGEGIPEYYEGVSKVIAVYIYPDTLFGPCTITILGELKEYETINGLKVPVPFEWQNKYNVRWQKTVNVNPLLANTTKVRFYRRPKVDVTESILPIYNRSVTRNTISGSVNGTPINPTPGADYKNFKGVLQYNLEITDTSNFSQSMEGEVITINGLLKEYKPTISDIVTNKKALVNVPYFITSSLVSNYESVTAFTSASYTMSFDESVIFSNSNISSSFARIKITDLETFAGDANRIKIYAKSRNSLGDFELLEDIQLESNELLIVDEFNSELNVRTGLFSQQILDNFWLTENLDTGVNVSLDNQLLFQSAKLEPTSDISSSTGLFKFYSSQSIEFTKFTEYQLDFTPLLSSSIGYGKIEIYGSGSAFVDTDVTTNNGKLLGTIETTKSFTRFDKQQINFNPDDNGFGNLVFLVKGGDWQISNITLRAAQESSFSPNEITLIANVPTRINNETFDFKIEIYDINNNYIPVKIEKTYTFSGGNDVIINRDLEVSVSNTSFNFNTSSAFPSSILIDYYKTALTGSVTFYSSAIDTTGNEITVGDLNPSTNYPGLLYDVDFNTKQLTIDNFTASLSSKTVGAIFYTASCENINRYFTIFRVDQGAPSYLFYATADKNNFTFNPDYYYKSVVDDDYIDIRLVQQNLPAVIPPNSLTIYSSSLYGPVVGGSRYTAPIHNIGGVGNASIYRLYVTGSSHQSYPDGDGFYFDLGQSTYDFELVTSDGTFTSSVTIDAIERGATPPTINFSNENTSLPSLSTGYVEPAAFLATTGSISVRVVDRTINYAHPIINNSFSASVKSYEGVTGANINSNAQYSITGLTNDSGSVTLEIEYRNIKGSSSLFQKQINYTKAKRAVPNVVITATPQAQTVLANATGTQTGTLSNVTVDAIEGSVSRFTLMTVASYSGFTAEPYVSGQTLQLSSATMNAGEGVVTLTVEHTDSENTTGQTKTVVVRTTKVNIGNDGDNGSNGIDAKAVALTADPQYTVIYDGDGTKTPVSITLTATAQNFTVPYYQFTQNGTERQAYSTTATYTIPDGEEAAADNADLWQVNVKENNAGSVLAFDNVDIFGIKAGTNAITAFLTNEAHTLPTTNTGVVTYTGSGTSVVVFKGATELNSVTTTPGLGEFKVTTSVTTGTITVGTQTITGNPAVFADHNAMSGDLAIIEYTINVENLVTLKKYQTLSKSTQGADGVNGANAVTINISPASQIITRSNTGTYGTPTAFTITVTEGTTSYTYDDSSPYANSTFRIANVSNGTNNNDGTITPNTPSTTAGVTVTFDVIYITSLGASVTLAQTHKVSVTLDGQTGPGVVFTGLWESGRAYQFSTGAGTGRRDVVLWSTNGNAPYDVYYAAIRQHTSAGGDVADGSPNQPSQTGWESLGTQDFFVAAKIGLFEESYVQNTLNVGTNNNGGVSSANITLAGGTQYPYISIGQSSVGYGNTGIWIGNDNGNYRASFVNGSTSFLKWNGTSLDIKGGLTATSGSIQNTLTIGGNGSAGTGITLDGVNQKIYMGTGDYANTNTAFFVSGSGDFSLKRAVIWNALQSLFSINDGILEIGTESYRTTINQSGLLTTRNAEIQGKINATEGSIGGWTIDSTTLSAGQASTKNIKINSSRPSVEFYDSANLVVDISGDATLSGTGSTSITTTSPSPFGQTIVGSSGAQDGTNIASHYPGTVASYLSGSGIFLTGSVSSSFSISATQNNSLVTITCDLGQTGTDSASFDATVDPGYYVSNAAFSLRYGVALYSSSEAGGTRTFVSSYSKSQLGESTFSNSNETVKSQINYTGSAVITTILREGFYILLPFVQTINASATAEADAGTGCNCPSAGTFYGYGDCGPSGQEIIRYTGVCDEFSNCTFYIEYSARGGCV